MRRHRRAAGFTLIEVLVALAVVSMAMLAVIGSAGQSTRTVAALRDRTFAEWVAANQLTELRLAPAWPALGDSDGDSQLAGEEWHWKVHVKKTADPDLRRIEIDVAHKDTPDSIVESLVGFIANQTPPEPPPGAQSGQNQGGNTNSSGNTGNEPGSHKQPVRRAGGGR